MNSVVRNIFLVCRFTFLEVVRSKLMIFIPIVALGLVTVSFLASSFAYGAPERIGIDIGLGLLSLTNLGLAIFLGATLISKEVENKTIYMIISKPISRTVFLAGKSLGLSLILIINVLCLTLVSSGIYFYFKSELNLLIFYVGLFSFFESFIVLLFSVFFSLITNINLSAIFSLFVWVLGNVLPETLKLKMVVSNVFLENSMKLFALVIPNFPKFNIKDLLLYEQNIKSAYFLKSTVYFILYSIFVFLVVDFVFKKKDFN